MSRMSKFLRQTCIWEHFQEQSDGTPVLNDFGEIQYNSSASIKCRRETYHKDVQTATGSIVRAMSRYYVDETASVVPDDRLDGHVVLSVVEYVNSLGATEGYEVYV